MQVSPRSICQISDRSTVRSSLMARLEVPVVFFRVKDRTAVDEVCVESVTGVVGHNEDAVWSGFRQILKVSASFQQGIQEPSLSGSLSVTFGHLVQPFVDCRALVGCLNVVSVRLERAPPRRGYESVSIWSCILRKTFTHVCFCRQS